jgi:hypothetical protein
MFMTTAAAFPILVAFIISSFVKASVTPLWVQENELVSIDIVKVPVTLGVQSRNSDALLCQTVFDRVLKRVADQVDLTFAYVAEYVRKNSPFQLQLS